MGQRRQAQIEAFEEASGIKPATGAMLDALNEIQRRAFELIRIVELEKSGIRDGDGLWGGSDPLGGTVADIDRAWTRVRELGGSASEDNSPVTTDEYFGGCPQCGKCEDTLNVGRTHWHVCHTHRVRWCVGANLFSSWRDEGEAIWRRNAALLEHYTETRPILPKPDAAGPSTDKSAFPF